MKKKTPTSKPKPTKNKVFPPGWNEKRVREVIDYYDHQTEDEALAEYEAAIKVDGQSMILVPTQLVPEIRRLINERRGA